MLYPAWASLSRIIGSYSVPLKTKNKPYRCNIGHVWCANHLSNRSRPGDISRIHYRKAPGLCKERRSRQKSDRHSAEHSPQSGLCAEMGYKNAANPSHTLPGGTWSTRGEGESSLAHASEGYALSRPYIQGQNKKLSDCVLNSVWVTCLCLGAQSGPPPRLPRKREEVVLIQLCLHSASDSEDNTFGGSRAHEDS